MLTRGPAGYKLSSVKKNSYGLTAKLTLAGSSCNAFGTDIKDLVIEVNYETKTRYAILICPHPTVSDVINQTSCECS
jgi:hypothetical protein